jgi:2-C-methyl-D-erythritol 4-phosphate cytidylyltransferase
MNFAIVLSGGVGTRMGTDIPKQYIMVNKRPVINYCIETFLNCSFIDHIVIVAADEWRAFIQTSIENLRQDMPMSFAFPGETRQYSIYNGLLEAKKHGADKDDVVIIHDAARPLVSCNLINACFEGCKEADGVLPVVPVKDTLYQSKDGKSITNLLNRSELFAGQAPEAFRFSKYLKLHEEMPGEELVLINGSTEIAYKGGLRIKLIKGDEMNFKITTPEDLTNFESIIKSRYNL